MKRTVILLCLSIAVITLVGCESKKFKESIKNGDTYLSDQKYEEAVAAFSTAVQEEPSNKDAANKLVEAKKLNSETKLKKIIEDGKKALNDKKYQDAVNLLSDAAATKEITNVELLKEVTELLKKAENEVNNDITGNWKRTDGSSYAGMEVKVERLDDGTFRGTISKTAVDFTVGDIKWKAIKKTKDITFDLLDAGTDGWYEMHMTYDKEGSTLHLRDVVKGVEEGAEQKWVRIQGIGDV